MAAAIKNTEKIENYSLGSSISFSIFLDFIF